MHALFLPHLSLSYSGFQLSKQYEVIQKAFYLLLNNSDNSVLTLVLVEIELCVLVCLVTPESAETGSVTLITVQQQVTSLYPQYSLLAHRVDVQLEHHHYDTQGRGVSTCHINHIQSMTAEILLFNTNHLLPSISDKN